MHEDLVNRRFCAPLPAQETPVADELLVSDARAGLSPAQMVERKLVQLLQNVPLPAGRPPVTAWRSRAV
jgi:hypothetical protein